ncbi:ABC transporter ATP-binding protein [Planctomycetota bacterium]
MNDVVDRGEIVVKVENVCRFFKDIKAADQVSFEFYKGDIFGFIGPNGAGKTTTMRVLATLDAPTSGDAFICSHSIIHHADRVRECIGYMPDSYGVYSNLNVEEYLDFFARSYGLKGARRKNSLAEIMDFTGLGDLRYRQSDKLSKGMRQRLSLARALIHDPPVLILDEPAEGLDPRARIEFRELLKVLAADGKAILISSHILTELSEICPRVAIIEKGRILKAGNVADIQNEITDKNNVLRIRVLPAAAGELEKVLLEQQFVTELRLLDDTALVAFTGKLEQQAELLRALMERELPVLEFAPHEQNLEDMFMTLTEGKLQ